MGKKSAPIEVSSFVGGLVSDAGALTFPQNASLDEVNITINNDGSRNRRLGMDFEIEGSSIETTITDREELAHTSFKWENVGGDSDKTLLVVQFGNELKFFDFDNEPLSSSTLLTYKFSTTTTSTPYSYTSVDGVLVVATGEKFISAFTYLSGAITYSQDYLKIRDLFGVEDVISSVDLREGNNVSTRPSTTTDAHNYNLRNQSFGKSVVCATTAVPDSLSKKDPLNEFYGETSTYPSNADSINQAWYSDANLSSGRTTDRFFVTDLDKSPIGTTQAANGYFIIDALERGTSRLEVYADNMTKYSELVQTSLTLPLDKTSGGPSVITQFAGRVWYGGFNSTIISGDNKSPRLSSYVLFSQLVEDPSGIYRCYQDGDPTSKDSPDLLDTDGGFLKIDEAYDITALISSKNCLFILAANGVWRVTGSTTDSGFTATSYSVSKVSDVGVISATSVVEAEGAIFFWGADGLYALGTNEYNDWVVKSISQGKIQKFYNNIAQSSMLRAVGFYDSYEHTIHWIYDNNLSEDTYTKELVYNLQLGSFTKNVIYADSTFYPRVIGMYNSPPFRFTPGISEVVVDGVQVVSGTGGSVVIGTEVRESMTREIGYIAVDSLSGAVTYRFCSYSDSKFRDWYSYDGVGIDAAGYLITGWLSAGDFQRNKQVQFLTTYFRKTETGFEDDFVPINPSSCLMQVQWDWSNKASSNKWGRSFQAYRHKRFYIPASIEDEYEDGNYTVVTRNKIRGNGRVLSLKLSTEPEKDMHIYGWSFLVTMQTDV